MSVPNANLELQARFASLNISEPQSTMAPAPSALRGLPLLLDKGIIDAAGQVVKDLGPFDPRLTSQGLNNVYHFLMGERYLAAIKIHLGALISGWLVNFQHLRPVCRMAADDLYRIVGYDKLSRELLKLYSTATSQSSGTLESFVAQDELQELRSRCEKKQPDSITLRLYICDPRQHKNIANAIQAGMRQFYGEGSTSGVKHEEGHSRFSFTTRFGRQSQSIHVVVTTDLAFVTTVGIVQVVLPIEYLQFPLGPIQPFIFDYGRGHQWLLDVKNKAIRIVGAGSNLTPLLFRHLRELCVPAGRAFDVVKREHLSVGLKADALIHLWQSLGDFASHQNLFLVAQIATALGFDADATSFFKTSFPQIRARDGFWCATGRLIVEDNLSFSDLEALLQFFGALFADTNPEAKVRVNFKNGLAQSLHFCPKDREQFEFLQPLDFSRALERSSKLLPQLLDKESFQAWLSYFIGACTESALIEFLLLSPNEKFRQVGVALLSGLKGNLELKSKWITHFIKGSPEYARRLILPIENEVEEPVMALWLSQMPQSAPLFFELLERALKAGNFTLVMRLAALRPNEITPEMKAKVITLLCNIPLTKTVAEWYLARIVDQFFTPDESQGHFCRKVLQEFPALVTTAHVDYMTRAHGSTTGLEPVLASESEEIRKAGAHLLGRCSSPTATCVKRCMSLGLELCIDVARSTRNPPFLKAILNQADVTRLPEATLGLLAEELKAPHPAYSEVIARLWLFLRHHLPPKLAAWSKEFVQVYTYATSVVPENVADIFPLVMHPEAISHAPSFVEKSLKVLLDSGSELTRANQSHIRAALKETIARASSSLAMILVKVRLRFCSEPLEDEIKNLLLPILEKDPSIEIIEWYLDNVTAKFFAPRHTPSSQVRLFLAAFKTNPSLITNQMREYLNQIASTPGNQKEEIERAEEKEKAIMGVFGGFLPKAKHEPKLEPTPLQKIQTFIRFKKWSDAAALLIEHTGQAEDVLTVCKELLELKPPDPKNQVFILFKKYKIANSSLWLQAFKAYAGEKKLKEVGNGVVILLKLKPNLPEACQKEIWVEILNNPAWMCQESSFSVFRRLDHIKMLLKDTLEAEDLKKKVIAAISNFVTAIGDSKQKKEYLTLAHTLIGELEDASVHVELGLKLISMTEIYSDVPDFIRDCKLLQDLSAHFRDILSSKQKRPKEPDLSERARIVELFCETGSAFFSIIAYIHVGVAEASLALSKLVKDLTELPQLDHLLVDSLHSYPSLQVREALTPSLCRIIVSKELAAQDQSNGLPQALLLANLLEHGSLDTVHEIYSHCIIGQFARPSEEFSDQAPQDSSVKPVSVCNRPLFTLLQTGYPRYLSRSLASSNPEDWRTCLDVDLSLSRHFARHDAVFIRKNVPLYRQMILQLCLRQIEHSGWTDPCVAQIGQFFSYQLRDSLVKDTRQVVREDYVYRYSVIHGQRFYQASLLNGDSRLNTIWTHVPYCVQRTADRLESERVFVPLCNLLISLCLSKSTADTSLAKARRLDLACELLRMLIERYPEEPLLPTQLLRLTLACNDSEPLYKAHCAIVLNLLRRAFQKKIIAFEESGHLLKAIHKEPKDLHFEGTELFKQLLERISLLDAANGGSFSESALYSLQVELLDLQEAIGIEGFKEREKCLKAIFHLWREHPAVIFNESIRQSMKMAIRPNSVVFGRDLGLEAATYAKQAAIEFIDSLFEICDAIQASRKQTIAEYCILVLRSSKKYGAFDGDYNAFFVRASRLLEVVQSCEGDDLIPACGECFLMPAIEEGAKEKRINLLHSLTQHIQTITSSKRVDIMKRVMQGIISENFLYDFTENNIHVVFHWLDALSELPVEERFPLIVGFFSQFTALQHLNLSTEQMEALHRNMPESLKQVLHRGG